MTVDITLLGGFAVRVDGTPVPDRAWRRRAASAVVKLLALTEGRSLHREQVVDLLWPHLSPAAAWPRLHQAAHYARRALGVPDGVALRRDRVMLLPGAEVRVDVADLHRRAEQVLGAGEEEAARHLLTEASGDLLPEDLYEEWTSPHRASLEGLRDRLRRLTGAESPAVPDARAVVAADAPTRALGGHLGRGRSRGLLLVIDDLTAADPAALRMLHHVAASVTARGIGRIVELG